VALGAVLLTLLALLFSALLGLAITLVCCRLARPPKPPIVPPWMEKDGDAVVPMSTGSDDEHDDTEHAHGRHSLVRRHSSALIGSLAHSAHDGVRKVRHEMHLEMHRGGGGGGGEASPKSPRISRGTRCEGQSWNWMYPSATCCRAAPILFPPLPPPPLHAHFHPHLTPTPTSPPPPPHPHFHTHLALHPHPHSHPRPHPKHNPNPGTNTDPDPSPSPSPSPTPNQGSTCGCTARRMHWLASRSARRSPR